MMKLLGKTLICFFAFWLIIAIFNCGQPSGSVRSSSKSDSSAVSTPEKEVFYADMSRNPYFELQLTRQQYKGKLLFDHYCGVCHGLNGDGNGFNSFNLQNSFGIRPFNFTDSTAVPKLKIDEIKKAIITGGNAIGKSQYMPPWGKTLREDEILAVVKYIQTFIPKL